MLPYPGPGYNCTRGQGRPDHSTQLTSVPLQVQVCSPERLLCALYLYTNYESYVVMAGSMGHWPRHRSWWLDIAVSSHQRVLQVSRRDQ